MHDNPSLSYVRRAAAGKSREHVLGLRASLVAGVEWLAARVTDERGAAVVANRRAEIQYLDKLVATCGEVTPALPVPAPPFAGLLADLKHQLAVETALNERGNARVQ